MKSRMKIVISILVLCMAFALVGCGKNTTPDAQKPGSNKENKKPDEKPQTKNYTVNFYDGSNLLSTKTVEENKTVTPISASAKEGYEFIGWYTDSSFTTKFDSSAKITADTNIYASYMSLIDLFIATRGETVNKGKFKYNYELDFTIKKSIAGLNVHPSAYYRGTVAHNKEGAKVSYYKDEKIGGALKLDRRNYSFLKTNESQLKTERYKYKGSLKPMGQVEEPGEDGAFIEEKQESFVGKDYDYSVFATTIFKYDDDKVDTVKKVGNNKYEVTFKKNIKDKALSFLSKIGMKAIEKELEKHGSSAFTNVRAYVTFNESRTQIKEFYYEFDLTLDIKNQIETEEEAEGSDKSKKIKLKGKVDFAVKYKMTFDNSFNGNITMPEKISDIVG